MRRTVVHGIPRLIEQLVDTLRAEGGAQAPAAAALVSTRIGRTAGEHGKELLGRGFTLDEVVHDYGDLCQAVTELAQEQRAPITVDEFRTFNRCLDHAIAEAVTAFGRQRDLVISAAHVTTLNERLGSLAHELRNKVNTAMLAFHALKTGSAALVGATGAVLDRSLNELTGLIDRSLAEVRLTAGLDVHREPIGLRALLEEVSVFAVMEAKASGRSYAVAVDDQLVVDADRQLLSSAIANLVQNALKFTPPGGRVGLRARAAAGRVLIEVEDECGGLPPGKPEELFRPFEQRSADRTGVGLGLSISRRAVEANGGTLAVRDLPNQGCVFTIDLPQGA